MSAAASGSPSPPTARAPSNTCWWNAWTTVWNAAGVPSAASCSGDRSGEAAKRSSSTMPGRAESVGDAMGTPTSWKRAPVKRASRSSLLSPTSRARADAMWQTRWACPMGRPSARSRPCERATTSSAGSRMGSRLGWAPTTAARAAPVSQRGSVLSEAPVVGREVTSLVWLSTEAGGRTLTNVPYELSTD